MTEKEFKRELLLEAKDAQQDMDSLEQEYRSPSWSFLDEEDHRGFYTGHQGKTLKHLKDEVNNLV